MSRYVTLHVTLCHTACDAGAGASMLQCRRPLADWSLSAPSLPSPGPPVCLYCTLYTVHTTVLYTLFTLHPAPGPWRGCWSHQARLPGVRKRMGAPVSRPGPGLVFPLCPCTALHSRLATQCWSPQAGVAGGGLGWAGLGWAGLGCVKSSSVHTAGLGAGESSWGYCYPLYCRHAGSRH